MSPRTLQLRSLFDAVSFAHWKTLSEKIDELVPQPGEHAWNGLSVAGLAAKRRLEINNATPKQVHRADEMLLKACQDSRVQHCASELDRAWQFLALLHIARENFIDDDVPNPHLKCLSMLSLTQADAGYCVDVIDQLVRDQRVERPLQWRHVVDDMRWAFPHLSGDLTAPMQIWLEALHRHGGLLDVVRFQDDLAERVQEVAPHHPEILIPKLWFIALRRGPGFDDEPDISSRLLNALVDFEVPLHFNIQSWMDHLHDTPAECRARAWIQAQQLRKTTFTAPQPPAAPARL